MKRDMDLIRSIMSDVEASDEPYLRFDGPSAYNVTLLHDAGLVEAHFTKVNGRGVVLATVERLTWSGHEFLDAMRDDTIWKKAKDNLLKPGASWTFSILMDFLKQEALRRLGGLTLP